MDTSLQEIKRNNLTLKTDLKICKRKYVTLAEENKVLSERLNLCEKKLDHLLYREKSKNVVIYKVPDTENMNKNLLTTVLDIVRKVIKDIPADSVVDVRRLGKQEGSRPILTSFNSTKWKSLLFQNRKMIIEMNYNIANDLPKEEMERRRKNYAILLKYKEFLSQSGKSAVIKGAKIIVDDNVLDVEEVKKLMDSEEKSVENQSDYNSESEESTTSMTSTASGTKRGRKLGSKNKVSKKPKTSNIRFAGTPIKNFLIPQKPNPPPKQPMEPNTSKQS